MDIGKYFECRGNRKRWIGGWMREQNIFLGHVKEFLEFIKSFWGVVEWRASLVRGRRGD